MEFIAQGMESVLLILSFDSPSSLTQNFRLMDTFQPRNLASNHSIVKRKHLKVFSLPSYFKWTFP